MHVAEATDVAAARRIAAQNVEPLGLGDVVNGRVALITTELATNLVKHGGGGSILFGVNEDRRAVVMIAIDKGPGITNVQAAMQDGFSTAGSPGTGLGAVKRSATSIDLYTLPNKGTAVLCCIGADDGGRLPLPVVARPSRIEIGGICIPKRGEEESGDAWTALNGRDVITIGIADGLGHGPAAATAAHGVIRVIREQGENDLARILEDAHAAVRATRGAAVGLSRIFLANHRLDFAGVGNIAASITTDDAHRKTVSMPGIIGHEMRRVQTFSYPWASSSVLVMQSDGVSANWAIGNYPGLLDRDPVLIAAVLFRDHCRGTDDATVVVAKATA
jgi:anti-sigma regulatory factor (Ser/Thr protein kinase)